MRHYDVMCLLGKSFTSQYELALTKQNLQFYGHKLCWLLYGALKVNMHILVPSLEGSVFTCNQNIILDIFSIRDFFKI